RNFCGIDECPGYRPAADFGSAVVGRDAEDIETSAVRFEDGLSLHPRADPGGSTVFDIDCRAHANLAFLTIWQQSIGGCPLHKPNHVENEINRWQGGVVVAERLLARNRLLGLAAKPHGNGFCHGGNLPDQAVRSGSISSKLTHYRVSASS